MIAIVSDRLRSQRGVRARQPGRCFHHTRDAIEAHLTIVFAALAVARHLQDATGLSVRKIVHTLRPLQQVSVRIAGHDHIAHDPLTPQAEHILHALGINRTDTPRWHESGGVTPVIRRIPSVPPRGKLVRSDRSLNGREWAGRRDCRCRRAYWLP